MAGKHRRSGDLDVFLDVDVRGPRSGVALEAALREAVRSGRLLPGTALPGSRTLADDLGVSRGTIVRAVSQLTAEGWLVTVPGSGTRIADVPLAAGPRSAPARDRAVESATRRVDWDLRPGRPDVQSFPRRVWATSMRRALASAAPSELDYVDPRGNASLRHAVAEYLARARGLHVDPDSVVVTAGVSHGLAVVGRVLRTVGVRDVAMEDPGLARHRAIVRAAAVGVHALPVGPHGARPDRLGDARAVVLTPAHQFPTGAVLSALKRTEFLSWARRRDGFIVEDDYDGEFRYDSRPVSAMQGLDPERVIYAGSVSKTLAPGFRLGWLVVPRALREEAATAVALMGGWPSTIEQLALADFIRCGAYDRHIRGRRMVYRRRRDELAHAVGTAGVGQLDGARAGLHALLSVSSPTMEHRLIDAGRRRGLRLQGLHAHGYWQNPETARPAALVLGYAAPPDHSWRQTLDAFSALLTDR